MPRVEQVVEILENRIELGDYLISGFPSERRLADELGVSRMTARRAVQSLEQEGLLERTPTGRPRLPTTASRTTATRTIGFLAAAFASPFVQHIRLAAERLGASCGMGVRSFDFVHWDDPIIGEVLENLDAVLLASSGELPEHIIARIQRSDRPVVFVETDVTAHGIPSFVLFPPRCVDHLLDHFLALGHRRIDCVNTLPPSPGLAHRIDRWRQWCARHGIAGELHDYPVEYFQSPMVDAHAVMQRLGAAGDIAGTALFFTSEFAAIGGLRGLHEAGIRVPADVSIGSLGGDGFYRFLTPTLTAIEMPDPEPYLRTCFAWFAADNNAWDGPLLLAPQEFPLYIGESSAPPREGP